MSETNTKLRRRVKSKDDETSNTKLNSNHNFSIDEVHFVRKTLLKWYDRNKRNLPWRASVSETDANIRGYSVWVSEVMAQQTQVATVINYYNRWMDKWPTLESLAASQLEDVNQMWSGLGYYSRGKRLHEGAQKVVKEMNGQMPRSSEDLEKLPGVGRYTACAIASITSNEVIGVIDGNCIRVLTRLKRVGSDFQSRRVTDWLWNLANSLVDPQRPGDFNQALMELGALVCTPKSPSCTTCPLNSKCDAYERVKSVAQQSLVKSFTKHKKTAQKFSTIPDIECVPGCDLCLPAVLYDTSLGVQNYPRKSKKKAARQEMVSVAVLFRTTSKLKATEFLITQRPDSGLLANMWEFPNVTLNESDSSDESCAKLLNFLKEKFGNVSRDLDSLGELKEKVLHLFSHIHCTYLVYACDCSTTVDQHELSKSDSLKWVTVEELKAAALSTAMRKVFVASRAGRTAQACTLKKRKYRKISDPACDASTKKITSFFKETAKKL